MLDRTIAYGLDFLFPAADTAVGLSLRNYGEFARPQLDFLIAMAGSTGTFIDVGANIGSIALPFAQQRPSWRVLAIEAHRGLAGILTANALNNRLFNVEAIHAAAGAASGSAEFPAASLAAQTNFGALGFGTEAEATETVRTVALDDVAPSDTRLVKVDVEGYEPDVLRGALRLLQSHAAIWVAEATKEHPKAAAEVIRIFKEAGYQVHWFYAPFATPNSPKGSPKKPTIGDANVVGLPRGAANPWQLSPVRSAEERHPVCLADYPYLRRYGY